jgi:hypothetical protein
MADHCFDECCYAECRYAECCILFIIMLNFIMLSVIMLKVVMLSVVVPEAKGTMVNSHIIDETFTPGVSSMTKKKSFQTLTPVESLVPAVASSPPLRPHCEPPWPATNVAKLMSFIAGLEAKKTRGFSLASPFSLD